MKDKFTVCVLLYGDHVQLAARCLNSICRGASVVLPEGLRIAMNAPGGATERFVNTLVEHGWVLPHNIYRSPENLHKYPMMRWMFNDERNPIETPYVMWFDDDSFIKDEMIGSTPGFLHSVADAMEHPSPVDQRRPDMCGGVYTIKIVTNQQQWIEDQPWYGDQSISSTMRFITGGWWTARLPILKKFDYPFEELDHRGGDVMLGALCEQQGLKIKNYRHGVAINADENGKESRASHRGFDQRPCGYDYRRDLRHVHKAQVEAPTTLGPMVLALARAKEAKEVITTQTPEPPEETSPGEPVSSTTPQSYRYLAL